MSSPAPTQRSGGFTPKHVGLVAWFSARFAMRTGGGLIYLLAAMLAGLGIASVFISPIETLMKRQEVRDAGFGPERAGDLAQEILDSDQIRDAVQGITGADDDQTTYLMRKNPALLSAIAIVLLIAFPFLTVFGAFNQTSGDIGSRGLRYLLLRTERVNVFLGRFVGTYLYMVLNTIALMTIVVLYVGLKLRAYEAGALIAWGAQVTVALCMIALAYAALCSWFSALIDSPAGALIVCLLVVGFPLLLVALLGGALRTDVAWLHQLLPWGWKWGLLSHDLGERLLAYGVMVGFAALFLALGLRTFNRRDL